MSDFENEMIVGTEEHLSRQPSSLGRELIRLTRWMVNEALMRASIVASLAYIHIILGLFCMSLRRMRRGYGALTPGGRVVISMRSAYRANFGCRGKERGGPRVAPPTREGFGRKYLTQIASDLPGAVGGLSFPPEGLN